MKTFSATLIKGSMTAMMTAMLAAPALAQTDSEKQQVSAQAIEICQTTAEQRYGEKSVRKIADKAKWSKGLNGAEVKMKIKPKSKKSSKYSCVVSIDKSVKFYRS